MISHKSSLAGSVNEEIPTLIEALLTTEQRLEELTRGEVDTVAGRDGRTFVLRRAEDQLRHSEATKQADILNALPAHLALLDTQGNIISVNEAWRQFADANLLNSPEHAVGFNYLGICDQARGGDSSEAHQVAAGVRAVLEGAAKSFSIEYPCHSPTEARWLLLTVTPLAGDRPNGAVVMHLNITERKRAEETFRFSEERLRAALAASRTGTFRWDIRTNDLSWDASLDALFGRPQGQTICSLEGFLGLVHHDDRRDVIECCERCAREGADFDAEFRVVWPDGSLHWLHDKGKTFFDAAGRPLYMTGACVDITDANWPRRPYEKARLNFARSPRPCRRWSGSRARTGGPCISANSGSITPG